MTITFTILGLPAPQGSKTNMPNGAMPPCKECLAAIRDRRDWWQGILEQQGAA